jgi:hypothetical protein
MSMVSDERVEELLAIEGEAEILREENEGLRVIIKRMRAALEFYKDPIAWKRANDPHNDIQVPAFYDELCFGDEAADALERIQS